MNNRLRTRLRTRCKNKDFSGFNVTKWLMDPQTAQLSTKYLKMVMREQRKWYFSRYE